MFTLVLLESAELSQLSGCLEDTWLLIVLIGFFTLIWRQVPWPYWRALSSPNCLAVLKALGF